MSRFVIRGIDEVVGKQSFMELVVIPENANLPINIDEHTGIWRNYEDSLEDKYRSSFRGLTALMDRKANLFPLNEKQFRDITPAGASVKEYEFKYQDLRAYGIKIEGAVLMILGGYKNEQKSDLIRFRALKAQYLDSIK